MNEERPPIREAASATRVPPAPEASTELDLSEAAREIADVILERDRVHGRRARPEFVEWRQAAGLRQADLAEIVGVSRGMIQAIEARRSPARPALVTAIANALKRPQGVLFEPPEVERSFAPLRVAQSRLGLSKKQCRNLIAKYEIPTTPGPGRSRLVDIRTLRRAMKADQAECEWCGKPTEPGLRWHQDCLLEANREPARVGIVQFWAALDEDPEARHAFLASQRAARGPHSEQQRAATRAFIRDAEAACAEHCARHDLLTVPDAARQLKVEPETVRRWIRVGRLPRKVARFGPITFLLVPRQSVDCLGDEKRQSWRNGSGPSQALIDKAYGGRARQRWKGRWAGAVAPRGGRPRGYSETEADTVLELKRQNPKLGVRPIAARAGLSTRQVHEILRSAPLAEGVS